MQVIFGNRWRHLLGELDFWEHVGGIDISLAPSSFGQANIRVNLGSVNCPVCFIGNACKLVSGCISQNNIKAFSVFYQCEYYLVYNIRIRSLALSLFIYVY